MKLTAIFLFAAFLQVNATGFSQSITISADKESLVKVLRNISKQSGMRVIYEDQLLARSAPVSIRMKNASVNDVLAAVFSAQPLMAYDIIEGKIIAVRQKRTPEIEVKQQEYTEPVVFEVRGKVTDADGKPLEGATVKLRGSERGTATDASGNFFIEVLDNQAILDISYLGYVPQEIKVSGSTSLTIVMKTEDLKMDEVVVVGYGSQKKTSLTAAVSTMQGEEIASVPVTNLSNGLGGRVPGLIVTQGSGEPGRDGSNIYIRGVSSIGSSQPLLIVDGIPRDFQKLDPNTIETFTVLKDAAAVAPYGVAGANGVILVTTKRGKKGSPSLSYNGYIGIQNPTARQKHVSPYEFAVLKNLGAKNSGLAIPYNENALQKFKDGSEPDVFPVDDIWGALARENAILTNHNIEVAGGTDYVKYFASFGYFSQQGLWPTTSEKKYNLALNLDATVTKTTRISFNLNGTVQKDTYPPIGTARIFELIGYSHPARGGPLVFSNGMYGKFIMGSIYNTGYAFENSTSLYSQLSLEQDLTFLPGLRFKGTVAYDPRFRLNKTWLNPVQLATIDTTVQPYVIKDGVFGQTKSSLTQSHHQSYQLTYQASLNYKRKFGEHDINALAVFEAKDNSLLDFGAVRRNYNLSIDELNMGSSSQADISNSGSSTMGRQLGVVYRLAYNYNSKYLFEASGRYDGSYFFAPENRFGFFPAFSVGWRLSEENFMKNIEWLNSLKIRGSYGEVGALAGNAFQYLSSYAVSGPAYVINGNAVQAVSERLEPNLDITWERAKKSNVGIEASILNRRINIEADYFFEKRSNMLVTPDVIVPAEYGIGLSQVNAGVMKNQGFEISVNGNQAFSQDLNLSLGANLTYAKNTLLQVFETAATFDNPNRRKTGRPLNTQFGYQATGFFTTDDFDGSGNLKEGYATQPWGDVQPGDIRYVDQNNDGEINNDDLTVIGDAAIPQIIYGISAALNYKQFNLDILFQGTGKRDFYFSGSGAWLFHNGMGAFTENLDYWTADNPNAKNPRVTASPTSNNTQASSFWMRNAEYLRLKSATLAYTLPVIVTNRLKMQSARVFISGQNLLTFSNIKSFDPEVSHNQGWTYPQQQVISTGVNITF